MIGIIADDITGANDIGIMYAKAGWQADVYPYPINQSFEKNSLPDVFIIDTNSRLDSVDDAYKKVWTSAKALESIGCTQFFNKTCSVFRGNIGAEFDAMLDVLEAEFAVIILGFPKNGRTTLQGNHYVRGTKLEESEFRNDPVHPMGRSDLVKILQLQTKRKVDLVSIDSVDKGSEKLKKAINQKRSSCNYLIVDVRDQTSLKTIAEAIKDEKIICGASGISEELALVQEKQGKSLREIKLPPATTGILCAAGSLMPQTYNQIKEWKKQQLTVFEMKSIKLLSKDKSVYLNDLIKEIVSNIRNGIDVLVHSSNEVDAVKDTKQLGTQLGFSNTEVSRLVSESLAYIVHEVEKEAGVNRFLLAGGETSASVCNKLGIEGLTVWEEIEPGLPSCVTIEQPIRKLVLKSGSFGSDDFFMKAISHLKE